MIVQLGPSWLNQFVCVVKFAGSITLNGLFGQEHLEEVAVVGRGKGKTRLGMDLLLTLKPE